jgi:hypothetical protein
MELCENTNWWLRCWHPGGFGQVSGLETEAKKHRRVAGTTNTELDVTPPRYLLAWKAKLTKPARDVRNPPVTDREKILIALREKPLKAFEIMKRVNIKNQDDCQSLLLKMRDDGAVKFDIHKGYWLAA